MRIEGLVSGAARRPSAGGLPHTRTARAPCASCGVPTSAAPRSQAHGGFVAAPDHVVARSRRPPRRLPPPPGALPPVAEGAQLLLATVLAYMAAAWPERPRGWVRKDLIEVRESSVAGRGVFAVAPIPAGTVIGQYPGRPRNDAAMTAKCASAPRARYYCFRTRGGMLLDPTDATGAPSDSPGPGLPWPAAPAALAYVNEPPRGAGGTNVSVEDDPKDAAGLLCVASRDVAPGEELFMDYGLTYDRSGYGAGQARREQQGAGGGGGPGGSGSGMGS